MKNFLYFFVNRDKTEFKIGITEDIEERYLRLTSLWGEIDLAASCMLAGSRREVAGLERTLHFLLENWRMEKPCRLEGRREWFSMACFEKAFEILQSAAGLRGFDLQDKLSRGIPIAMRETRDRVVRERPAVETIANFDGIKQLWPAILGAFETYQQCHDFMASHLLPWLSGGGEAVQDHGFSPSTPLDNQDSEVGCACYAPQNYPLSGTFVFGRPCYHAALKHPTAVGHKKAGVGSKPTPAL